MVEVILSHSGEYNLPHPDRAEDRSHQSSPPRHPMSDNVPHVTTSTPVARRSRGSALLLGGGGRAAALIDLPPGVAQSRVGDPREPLSKGLRVRFPEGRCPGLVYATSSGLRRPTRPPRRASRSASLRWRRRRAVAPARIRPRPSDCSCNRRRPVHGPGTRDSTSWDASLSSSIVAARGWPMLLLKTSTPAATSHHTSSPLTWSQT